MNPNDDPIALATKTLDASYWRERAQRLEDGIRAHSEAIIGRKPALEADAALWALLDEPHDG